MALRLTQSYPDVICCWLVGGGGERGEGKGERLGCGMFEGLSGGGGKYNKSAIMRGKGYFL